MTLRHTAALALVGWYLMMPPKDENLPLSKWRAVESYDAASACMNAKIAYFHRVKDLPDTNLEKLRILDMQCVSTDDPRLAK
jgi:hypothetical protein